MQEYMGNVSRERKIPISKKESEGNVGNQKCNELKNALMGSSVDCKNLKN